MELSCLSRCELQDCHIVASPQCNPFKRTPSGTNWPFSQRKGHHFAHEWNQPTEFWKRLKQRTFMNHFRCCGGAFSCKPCNASLNDVLPSNPLHVGKIILNPNDSSTCLGIFVTTSKTHSNLTTNEIKYTYHYIPRTQMTPIFEGQPPKTRPCPIKTEVI